MSAATEAFEVARLCPAVGLYLHELLALAELYALVRQQEQAMARMKLVVHKMLGPTPSKAKLDSLGRVKLPAGVSLSAIMAA